MRRTISLSLALLLLFCAHLLDAQNRGKLTFENIYRPIYGYVIDTLTNQPCQNVVVYSFDSLDEAMIGKDALSKGRNPLKLKLKGDVVETNTDDTGRYMLPVRNQGALLFYFKEKGVVVIEEVAGRSNVSLGKKEKKEEIDLSKYLDPNYRPEPLKYKRKEPVDLALDMRFNSYINALGKSSTDSRVIVERRVVDMETGELLAVSAPVVRDGKAFHKQRKKAVAKGLVQDTLFNVAKKFPALNDSTYRIPVHDPFNTGQWKENWFKLAYVVRLEDAAGIKDLDTMYMYTNRVSKPLRYLETDFGPYMVAPEEYDEVKGLPVKRRLVLKGEYTGEIPQTLRDSAYVLNELHIKASVNSEETYEGNIAVADSLVEDAMKYLRVVFEDKLSEETRVIKVSEVASDTASRNRVEYRFVFRTDRNFSRNDYVSLFSKAKDDDQLEALCRRALEESVILENQSWDYAANMLSAVLIRRGKPDVELLKPFIDTTLHECDMVYDDPVLYRPILKNRRETVANQVIMLMMSQRYEEAATLAGILPDRYSFLRDLSWCKAGNEPDSRRSIELISGSSLRNKVVMDIYRWEVDESTMAALDQMRKDDAMTWYLKACCICIMAGNDLTLSESKMAQVQDCLQKCFSLDDSLKASAIMEADIHEEPLKRVLNVPVL